MANNISVVKWLGMAGAIIGGGLPFMNNAFAATSTPVLEQSRVEGIVWLLNQQNGDGSWGDGGAKVAATSEALLLFKNSSLAHSPHYARGLSWLANSKTDSTDYFARKIIAMEGAGLNTSEMGLIDELHARKNTSNSWGTYSGDHPSVIDSSLALAALYQHSGNLGPNHTIEVNGFFNTILSAQQANNNGWPHMGGHAGAKLTPQVIPTAMALQTMAPILNSRWNVLSNTNRAVNWLVSKQHADGRFIDSNENSSKGFIPTATSYKALRGLVDANVGVNVSESVLITAQDYLFTEQSINGSWADDSYQTALVLNTLDAITLVDTDSDGIPDNIEQELGSNVNVADSVDYIQDNGIGSHFSLSSLMTQIIVNTNVNYTFDMSGAQGAVTWKSTSLPPGLSFNAGVITGQPTQAGSYTFTIEVSDLYDNVALSSSRIEVIAANNLTIDTDNDSFPSSWEIANGFDPLNANDADLARTFAEANDTDGDGLSDYYELVNNLDPYVSNNGNTDTDNDGLTDEQEYALGTNIQNPDTDSDSMPDGWEVRYGLNPLSSADMNLDKDYDGLTNRNEYIYNANPSKPDTDGDKVLDNIEVRFGLLANNKSDTDNDGMPNDWETVFNLNLGVAGDASEDADNDSLSNLTEYTLNTNPQNPDSDNDGTNDGDEVAVNRDPLMNEPAILVAILSVLL